MLNEEKNGNDTTEDKILFQTRIFDVVERYQIGQSGKRHPRYVVRNKGAVAILPILPDGRIILIKQFRSPAQRYIYEIPAGTREIGEDPLKTACRELIEETGYHAGKMDLLCSFYSSPGIFQEELFLYRATELVPGESAMEDGEDITLVIVDRDQIRSMIRNGEIHDGKTLLALLTIFFPDFPENLGDC